MNLKYWFGKEIEGRLYGLESVFISDDLTQSELDDALSVHHVLIGTPLIDKLLDPDIKTLITWELILEWIGDSNKFVTLEVKPSQIEPLPQAIKLRCHILLWLDVPELKYLKNTDSVKFCSDLHEMYVTSLMNSQHVTKNDYYHDRYVK